MNNTSWWLYLFQTTKIMLYFCYEIMQIITKSMASNKTKNISNKIRGMPYYIYIEYMLLLRDALSILFSNKCVVVLLVYYTIIACTY